VVDRRAHRAHVDHQGVHQGVHRAHRANHLGDPDDWADPQH
jgi:hypothetical protein